MIATIAGTAMAGVTVIITKLQRNIDSNGSTWKAKGGARRLPLLLFCFVVSEAR